MKGSALGIIETTGRACLIEAVDSAIKCASVNLKASYFVGGGLNAVTLTGDVGAMRAALDAAKAVLERMNAEGVIHLIPRLADEVWSIVDGGINPLSGFSSAFSQKNIKQETKEKRSENVKALQQDSAQKIIPNAVVKPAPKVAPEQKPKQTVLPITENKTVKETNKQEKTDIEKKAQTLPPPLNANQSHQRLNARNRSRRARRRGNRK